MSLTKFSGSSIIVDLFTLRNNYDNSRGSGHGLYVDHDLYYHRSIEGTMDVHRPPVLCTD